MQSGASGVDVTGLLRRAASGDRTAEGELFTLMYDELRGLAARHLRLERTGHTLQTTALLHEAYLKLIQMREMDWQCRGQFYAIAARMMRRVLIDHARGRRAAKRDGGLQRVDLEAVAALSPDDPDEILAIDRALDRLREKSRRASQLVEMKFFGGLSFEEVALALGISERTAKRDWQTAKAWLYRELHERPAGL